MNADLNSNYHVKKSPANRSFHRNILATIKHESWWLINILLPAHCLLCHTPLLNEAETAFGLCPACKEQCLKQADAVCPICAEPYNSTNTINHVCSHCLSDPPPFVWLKAAGIYTETVAAAIHKFKYQGKPSLSSTLSLCLLKQLKHDIITFNPQTVVAVPLHINRLRQRGYNQSLLIARQISKNLHLPICTTALKRIRHTDAQALLNARQRRDNLRSAFSIGTKLSPQRILLVDDIATTTSTVRACAKLLSQQGHTVAVVTVSRASLT